MLKKQTETAQVGQIHCFRCGFNWYPKNPNKTPSVCARCKNTRFAVPRSIAELDRPTNSEQTRLDNYLLVMREGGSLARAVQILVDDHIRSGA